MKKKSSASNKRKTAPKKKASRRRENLTENIAGPDVSDFNRPSDYTAINPNKVTRS